MSQKHIVQSGECMATLARRYGFKDYHALYDHADNAELKRARPSPNVLYPGDVVSIPDREDKVEKLAVDKQHRLRVHRPKKELRITLHDGHGEPLASKPYVLQIDGRDAIEGSTDGDGKLREPIPIGARSATLTIQGRRMRLSFGALTPASQAPDEGVLGAQARLRNLGYLVQSLGGQLDPSTHGAIAMFQHEHALTVDGGLGPELADKLVEVHGS